MKMQDLEKICRKCEQTISNMIRYKKESFIKGLAIRCPISPASYINVASDGMSAVASRFCQTVAFFLDPVQSAQFQYNDEDQNYLQAEESKCPGECHTHPRHKHPKGQGIPKLSILASFNFCSATDSTWFLKESGLTYKKKII